MPAPDARPTVLVLCVHDAGRSRMAPGRFAHLAGDRAGAAMAEVGTDISGARPARRTDEVGRAADVVVTMGCGDTCPAVPGTRDEDRDLDDPAGPDVAAVRPVRDAIRARVEALRADLGVPTAV